MNYFSLQDLNENRQEVVEETEEEFFEQTEEEQWATITMQEYSRLKQFDFEVQKLQNTIHEMTQVIASKDSQLEDLRTIIKREKNKFIDVSELAQVRV